MHYNLKSFYAHWKTHVLQFELTDETFMISPNKETLMLIESVVLWVKIAQCMTYLSGLGYFLLRKDCLFEDTCSRWICAQGFRAVTARPIPRKSFHWICSVTCRGPSDARLNTIPVYVNLSWIAAIPFPTI